MLLFALVLLLFHSAADTIAHCVEGLGSDEIGLHSVWVVCDKHTILVDKVGELNQVLVNWVLVDVLLGLCLVQVLAREDDVEDFLVTAERIDRASFSFRSFEEIFRPWIKSLVWVLSGAASASSTGWWVSQLAIRTL